MATINVDAYNSVCGLVLLPDDWTTISTVPFAARGSMSTNQLTFSQWDAMEVNGAVFLPAAGNRYGTTIESAGDYGFYWTATSASNTNAYSMVISTGSVSANRSAGRCSGRAVRLVQNVN